MSRFQFVADHQDAFEVKRLCELLEVERSSFYAWQDAAPVRQARVQADARLGRMVRRMPEGKGMSLNHNLARLFEKRVWAATFGDIGNRFGPYWGDTPEEALIAAGLGEPEKGEGEK